jgi:class 3 adenylate cyclase
MTTPPLVVVREPGRVALHLVVVEPLDIGRDCAGLLVGDARASRRHARLAPEGERLMVTDLGSTNGTTVDDRPLDGPHELHVGEILRIGDTTVERIVAPWAAVGPPVSTATLGALATDVRATSIDLVAAAVAEERPAMAPEGDAGTITIVFSDIEDSTAQAVEVGDTAWMEILDLHNAIVRRHVSRFRGTEVKAQGDGFMLTFGSARAALEAMIQTQRALDAWARSQPARAVRVRVGVHTGEVIRGDDGDLYGKHVVIAARVAAAARGGEILVSSLVREIVEARGDLAFGDARSVPLKGLQGLWTLHPVRWQPA